MQFKAVSLHPLRLIRLAGITIGFRGLRHYGKTKNRKSSVLLPILPNSTVKALVRFLKTTRRGNGERSWSTSGNKQDHGGEQDASMHVSLLSLFIHPI
jgi:hypothetical protein